MAGKLTADELEMKMDRMAEFVDGIAGEIETIRGALGDSPSLKEVLRRQVNQAKWVAAELRFRG